MLLWTTQACNSILQYASSSKNIRLLKIKICREKALPSSLDKKNFFFFSRSCLIVDVLPRCCLPTGIYRKGIRAVSQPADASVQYC